MKPGIYDDLTNEEYHGGPGISKSGLDLVARSPMHFHHAQVMREKGEKKESTPAQVFGTAFHCLLLEPHLFRKQYTRYISRVDYPDAIDDREILVSRIEKLNDHRLSKLPTSGSRAELVDRIIDAQAEMHVVPDHRYPREQLEGMKGTELTAIVKMLNDNRPGKLPVSGTRHALAGILAAEGMPVTLWSDLCAEWERNNGDKTILSADDFDALYGMQAAVMAHPAARRLLELPGLSEQSVYWTDKETGELCRVRPDRWLYQHGIVLDVKTTEDASAEEFARSIFNYSYHMQHAMYVDGCNHGVKASRAKGFAPVKEFVFLAVEKKAPYAVSVFRLCEDSIAIGELAYREALTTYARCRELGVWPGYGKEVQQISLPGWVLARHGIGRQEA